MSNEEVKGEGLSMLVKKALTEDLEVGALDVRVNTENGIIHLDGIVDVLADKEEAERIASRVRGVKGVENRLAVAQDGIRKDKELSKIITAKFNEESDLLNIGVIVKSGRVFLKGKIKKVAQEQKAMQLTRQIIGVKDIVSNLKIISKEDSIIGNEVSRVLNSDQRVDSAAITIEVEDGKAILTGSVLNIEIKELVNHLLAEIEGLQEINNELVTHKGGVGGDTALEAMIRRELGQTDGVSPVQVKVYVVGGSIFLDGEVDSPEQHETAIKVVRDIIRNVKGVNGLNDGIKVTGKKASKSEK
ncbi:BON domain-containing protein [Selenihalanaerobacter shriftii]|uniref:Osmotically-inducible protein OsmY, contains BON domain n=1 Tax=Selenihalanaerobacter shriftii TaxID=142842 RepID=A0A1T4JN65_9FIRM|nr:BON domain-containing protein [Selenihalanaerobacter shriftii]SJZ31465.1 Osmotically-inducible protein OsmY, contains BON domain [Selenihalanaerobacter shriftii]